MDIRTILSVDDNPTDQIVHQRRIEQHDPAIEVRHAGDGLRALEILGAGDFWPDLVFLDINMPRLDGFGFLAACQAQFAQRPLHVILTLTSPFQQCDVERSAAYPMVRGSLFKPLTRDWYADVMAMLES